MNEVCSAAYQSNRVDTEITNMRSKSCFKTNVRKKVTTKHFSEILMRAHTSGGTCKLAKHGRGSNTMF